MNDVVSVGVGSETGRREATMRLTAVVAMTPSGVIGRDGDMPWRLSSDLRRFKRLTMGGVLIMGRRTFDSIGRALPGRRTIVITRQEGWSAEGTERAGSPAEAVQLARSPAADPAAEHLPAADYDSSADHRAGEESGKPGQTGAFVVGGAEIYRQLMPRCTDLYLTRVWSNIEGDTKLAIDLSEFRVIEQTRLPASSRDDVPTEFIRLIRRES